MDVQWPEVGPEDRCALCGGSIPPDSQYVLTHDDDGDSLWWHMDCRDVMIPVLSGSIEPVPPEMAGEDA